MLEVVMPKNYLNLFAGLVSLAFERLATVGKALPEQPEVVVTEVAKTEAIKKEVVEPLPPVATSVKPDDLTLINGIGPTFARRLNEAGINTFAKLAATKPEEVKVIAKVADWQAVDPAHWVAMAKQLA